MPQNTDRQVLRTFHQEVRAALPELRRHLGRLAENPTRRDALRKAHRLVQGLSGAASLLGLANWSETGSAVGHFLDEVVSGAQSMTAEAAQELQSTLQQLEAELAAAEGPEPPRFELEDMEGELSLDAPPPDIMDEADDECRFELFDVDVPEALQALSIETAAATDVRSRDQPSKSHAGKISSITSFKVAPARGPAVSATAVRS